MAPVKVGDRVSFHGKTIHWVDGRPSPSWCVEPNRTFEVIEVAWRQDKQCWRVVIGNHRSGNGPITKGVTGAIWLVG